MFSIRRSQERGKADHGWLKSWHTFSFSQYYDEKHMGFRSLRVINEDKISPGMGFGTHPHRDMEIITYVMEGSLEHKDSMGNSALIQAGEIQRMSAGTGITHSEFNHEKEKETHLLQIWIVPESNGIAPSYGQKSFSHQLKENIPALVVSKDGREGSVSIHQDADIYLARLKSGQKSSFKIRPGRGLWLQVVQGSLVAGRMELFAGDALVVEEETLLEIKSHGCEYMLFDLAKI